jgi:hypothetical protein
MGGPAIAVTGLRKSFGKKEAVAGIDLEIATGSLAGLAGPNGAGKTPPSGPGTAGERQAIGSGNPRRVAAGVATVCAKVAMSSRTPAEGKRGRT